MAKLTPLKAIRKKCLECCVGNRAEVKRCPIVDCGLYSYRFGHNPTLTGTRIGRGSKKKAG